MSEFPYFSSDVFAQSSSDEDESSGMDLDESTVDINMNEDNESESEKELDEIEGIKGTEEEKEPVDLPRDPDPSNPNAGAAHSVIMYSLFLVIMVLATSFNEPVDAQPMHRFQYLFLLAVSAFYVYMAMGLNAETSEAKEAQRKEVEEACRMAKESNSDSGVTPEWYASVDAFIKKALFTGIIGLAILLLDAIRGSSPDSVWTHMGDQIESGYLYLLENYTHRTLFVIGVWLCDFVTFWLVGGLFLIADLTRPAFLNPFKIQENFYLTWDNALHAISMALRNQALVLIATYFLWDIYPLVSPNGFSPELPSVYTALISLLAMNALSEIWFYSTHRLMHASDWLWSHIHFIHHEWISPIGITSIYAHPVEHIFVNIVTVMIGPFILGSHISLWWAIAILGIFGTVTGHSGWHIPFLSSNEGHNFHHSNGWGNFGTAGIMDPFFGTNYPFVTTWHYLVDKRYTNAMYPIQKILASNGQPISSEISECRLAHKSILKQMNQKVHK